MALFPLSRENYEFAVNLYQWFPVVFGIQLALPHFYPAGKTSMSHYPLNLPGKATWMVMELTSPALFLTTIFTSGAQLGPPVKVLCGLFLTHYSYRAVISPLMNPSMAPMNLLIGLAGVAFNTINPLTIGGWMTNITGEAQKLELGPRFWVGVGIWALGFLGNIYHEERLRSIRKPGKGFAKSSKDEEKPIETYIDGRRYQVPTGGLFEYSLHAHYLSEWIEWTGFCIAAKGCYPAILFLVAELATMVPRAIQGKRWYKQKFGDKLPKRAAAIPGLL